MATNYNVNEFWTKRAALTEALKNAVNSKLNEAFAECTGFQILKISIPTANEETLINTQVAVQNGQQKMYQQQASNIRTQIEVDTSDSTKLITIIQGEAQAEATAILNKGDAFVKNLQITSQA